MRKVLLLLSMGALCFCTKVSAQRVNTDSLKLVSRISEDQLKLGKLQNTVDQKSSNKQDDSAKAQQSADRNVTEASRLSNDPENKKDARDAKNAASDAKIDARKARKANGDLDKLRTKISDLQIKISDEQMQLSKYNQPTPPVTTVVAPVQSDTTQHQ